jgi:hypothetical protein
MYALPNGASSSRIANNSAHNAANGSPGIAMTSSPARTGPPIRSGSVVNANVTPISAVDPVSVNTAITSAARAT